MQGLPWPDELASPIAESFLSPSPVIEEERPNANLGFSYLSANFSTESLYTDNESPSTPIKSPYAALGGSSGPPGNFPYMKKYNGSSGSLQNSPAAPVGQQSNLFHQRAGSNSASSRPRPRSMLGADNVNYAIWENKQDFVIPPDNVRNKRNSFHATPRGSYTPTNLPPPTEPRAARSRSGSPSRGSSPIRKLNTSPYRQRASSPSKLQPFNFQPQDIMMHGNSSNLSLVVKPAHRKGHRYKHSSVSMNLFQEPVPIADTNHQPDLIPDLYPIPDVRESLSSATSNQKFKLALALAHFVTSVVVLVYGIRYHQSAFSTLAHLVFYDSLGSLVVACVDVISRFEVWSKPSIAYPFGLGRLEVLAGFALSTSLVMVGCDLVSHFVEELIVGYVDAGNEPDHGSHHVHHHAGSDDNLNWVLYEAFLVLVIVVTWFTSICIFEEASISEIMNSETKLVKGMFKLSPKKDGILDTDENDVLVSALRAFVRTLVRNPIRMLTLFYSTFLLLVPFIPANLKDDFGYDIIEASTLVVAATLCYAGWNLVHTLGGILLVSFPYSDYDLNVLKATIHDQILALSNFKDTYFIGSVQMSKVNHKLYIVCIEAHIRGGSADDESRLLFEINRIVARVVGDFDSGCQVETTISASRI